MNPHNSAVARALVGAWLLISFKIEYANETAVQLFGSDVRGSIIYTDTGRVAVQVMRGDRPAFGMDGKMGRTPEEIEAGYKACISYYGSYVLDGDGDYVVHQVRGPSVSKKERRWQKRSFTSPGNRPRLSTAPMQWGGDQCIGVPVWEGFG